MIVVRAAVKDGRSAIWSILEPAIRAGETYTLLRGMSRDEALDYWFGAGHAVFVAKLDGEIAAPTICGRISRAL
jgi:hypothetical protein